MRVPVVHFGVTGMQVRAISGNDLGQSVPVSMLMAHVPTCVRRST
jgi:hypothetical protein